MDFSVGHGYSVGIDSNHDEDEEFNKPGYREGPSGYVGPRCREMEGAFASVSAGRIREVDREERVSAQADGPRGFLGSGGSKDGVFLGFEGSVVEAECHAGPFGLGVQGPGALGTYEAGKKGLHVNGEVNVAEGKVDIGPVKLGAGVGASGKLRVGYGGLGAIVPGVGGLVVAKEGLEFEIGVFNFKIGW